VAGDSVRGPAIRGRRRGIAAAIYAALLIAIASFGFGRAWEPLVTTVDGFLQSIAVFQAAHAAVVEALKSNAAFPSALPVLPHTITVYPILALRRNEEGDVLLRVLVQANGEVGDARIIRSSGHAQLDAAALIGVGYWYYVPAVRDHQAVDCWVTVLIRFRIPDKGAA
jgi:TonB family protein